MSIEFKLIRPSIIELTKLLTFDVSNILPKAIPNIYNL